MCPAGLAPDAVVTAEQRYSSQRLALEPKPPVGTNDHTDLFDLLQGGS